jgi:peptidoglycan/LPS O-acetylase OafA/YrhL
VPNPIWAGPFRLLEGAGIDLGQIGVAMFYLTSGFVIPYSLKRGGPVSFAIRRFFRIYPVFWLSLITLVLLLLIENAIAGTTFPFPRGLLPLNAVLLQPYFGHHTVDGVNITLAIEEFFYVSAAVLALRGWITRPHSLIWLAGGLAAVSGAVALLQSALHRNVGALHGLAFITSSVVFILIGVIFHLFYNNRDRRLALAGAGIYILFLASVLMGPTTEPYAIFQVQTIVSNTIALALFWGACILGPRLPYSRLIDWLADISYPLYLFHSITGYIVLSAVIQITHSYVLALVVALAVVLAVAAAVQKWIEAPSMALGKRLAQRRTLH